jgi:hypothetical protein
MFLHIFGEVSSISGWQYILSPGGPLSILLGTDVPLRFSKHPPFIYSIFLKTIPIHIFPLNIYFIAIL